MEPCLFLFGGPPLYICGLQNKNVLWQTEVNRVDVGGEYKARESNNGVGEGSEGSYH